MHNRLDIPDAHFRLFFEKNPAPCLVLFPDEGFTIVEVSEAYLRATTTKRVQLIGRRLFEAFPDNPGDPGATGTANLRTSLERAVATREPDRMAFQRYDTPRSQGGFEERYWSPVNVPVLSDEGEVLYLIHRVEDVTEFVRLVEARQHDQDRTESLQAQNDELAAELLRRSEELNALNAELRQKNEALRQSQARLSRALEIETVGVLFFDMESNFLDANEAFLRMIGMDREALTRGELRSERVTLPEWMPRTWQAFEELRANGRFSPYEKELVRPDGSRWWGLFAGARLSENECVEFVLDVTERKRAEQAVCENEARFRALAHASSDVIYRMSPDWREMRELDGRGFIVDTSSASDTWLEQYIHPDDQPQVVGAIEQAIRTKNTFELEHRVRRVDGGLGWTASRAVPLLDEQGNITEWVGAASDVTERKRAEEALHENARRKDEFLAMLAHELRNPLGAIGNTVKLLERRAPEADLRRYLDILQRQTKMLRGLVDDLLDVSRITRGLVELKCERVDLAAVAERALESVQPLMDEKRHEVSVTRPRKGLPVLGDPVRLEQILVNLLTNAAKYTDPGGQITLCLERKHQSVELRVCDTGIGMTPEVLGRIFDLFGQADRGLARSEGGLGIGLTIVKSLVELHDGRIEARSAGLGEGAEFIVTLPLAPVEEAGTAPVAQESAAAIRAKRILVVEDSQDIAETLALLLEGSGHEVMLAHDGPNALAMAEEFDPEVILLDIGLPGMDGYEVARRLRQNRRIRSAVLAALTGYGQADDVERAEAAGFDKHFVKPIDIDALETFVNSTELSACQ